MALVAGGGFVLSGTTEPNFSRDNVEHVADLKKIGLSDLDRGHIVFCKEDGKRYEFDSDGLHTSDASLGYFKLYQPGGNGRGSSSFYIMQNNSQTPSPSIPITAEEPDITEYFKGLTVYLKLTYPTSSRAKFKLNDLEAKTMMYRGSELSDGFAYSGDTITLVFDGIYWVVTGIDRYIDNSSYYAKCETSATITSKVIVVPDNYVFAVGNIITAKFTHAVDPELDTTVMIRRESGAVVNNLPLYYNDARKPLPIEAGSSVVMVYTETGGGRWEIQTSTAEGEAPPSTSVVVQDSKNYDVNDDASVPTVKAAAEIAKDEIKVFSEEELQYKRQQGKVRPATADDGVDGYVFEVNSLTKASVVDWRNQDETLNVFLDEDCANEIVIYYSGSKGAIVVDSCGYIGEIPIVEVGKEYVLSIQDNIKVSGIINYN